MQAVTELVRTCGAVPVRTDPAAHDRWVALISHAPHLVAAAMAACLEEAPGEALDLAGQGLRDVTRIAAGDTALWTQILSANAAAVSEVLAAVAADLAEAARVLADGRATRARPSRRCSTAARRAWPGSPASTAARPASSPSSRWSSPTSPASWPGCSTRPARPASTSRTCGSSTRPASRSASPSCPSAPREAGVLLDALEAGGWPVRR